VVWVFACARIGGRRVGGGGVSYVRGGLGVVVVVGVGVGGGVPGRGV